MRATIERRVLVNYRVDPDAVSAVLPVPLRPRLVDGWAVGGICLIRLGNMRPQGFPRLLGITSENAAHRIAVEWTDGDQIQHGVYVPRRDTTSRMSALVGGRLFPGRHTRADFTVTEQDGHYDVGYRSRDGTTGVSIRATISDELPTGSVFGSLEAASDFFRRDRVGYSDTARPGRLDAIELEPRTWNLTPLSVTTVRSSYFETQPNGFPPGSAQFDSAFLMRRIDSAWRARPDLRTATVSSTRFS